MSLADALSQAAGHLRTFAARLDELAANPITLDVELQESDSSRADWRRRLQDPQEIEALKKRLGLK